MELDNPPKHEYYPMLMGIEATEEEKYGYPVTRLEHTPQRLWVEVESSFRVTSHGIRLFNVFMFDARRWFKYRDHVGD